MAIDGMVQRQGLLLIMVRSMVQRLFSAVSSIAGPGRSAKPIATHGGLVPAGITRKFWPSNSP